MPQFCLKLSLLVVVWYTNARKLGLPVNAQHDPQHDPQRDLKMAMLTTRTFLLWLQLLWFSGINCKHDHPIPTYFGRVHPNGTTVDAKNPANRLKLNFVPKMSALDPGAVLKVSPSSEIQNGQTVSVAWSGVSSPSAKDVVILYCPPDVDPNHYLDFVEVSSIETYAKGYGEFQVVLWNLRKECQFGYYRNDNYTLLVTKSDVLTFEGGAEVPLQGHIALTGNPTEMRVMWVSGSSKLCNQYLPRSVSFDSVALIKLIFFKALPVHL